MGQPIAERHLMDSTNTLPPIERWWPELSIEAKHSLKEDLHGEISESVLKEIASLTNSDAATAPQRLGDDERDYIATQTEIVD